MKRLDDSSGCECRKERKQNGSKKWVVKGYQRFTSPKRRHGSYETKAHGDSPTLPTSHASPGRNRARGQRRPRDTRNQQTSLAGLALAVRCKIQSWIASKSTCACGRLLGRAGLIRQDILRSRLITCGLRPCLYCPQLSQYLRLGRCKTVHHSHTTIAA
jgi:hypothetical protein